MNDASKPIRNARLLCLAFKDWVASLCLVCGFAFILVSFNPPLMSLPVKIAVAGLGPTLILFAYMLLGFRYSLRVLCLTVLASAVLMTLAKGWQ